MVADVQDADGLDDTDYLGETGDLEVVVIRSARRKKTASGKWVDGKVELRVPQRASQRLVEQWSQEIVAKLMHKQRNVQSDEILKLRAKQLQEQYLPEGPEAASIRWVTNQNMRWGSCTISTRCIRLSHRMQTMPQYVIDYVLLHELVHLLVSAHDGVFYSYLNRYPHAVKAQGYLEGFAHASNRKSG